MKYKFTTPYLTYKEQAAPSIITNKKKKSKLKLEEEEEVHNVYGVYMTHKEKWYNKIIANVDEAEMRNDGVILVNADAYDTENNEQDLAEAINSTTPYWGDN